VTAPFGTLIARARSFVRDEGGSFIDDDDLGNWINEAYRDIAARLEVMQHEVEGDIWSTFDHLDLPPDAVLNPDVVVILSLRFETTDVQFVADQTFNQWRDDTASPPTTLGRVFDGKIEVYPLPAEGVHYVLRYAYIPDELVQPNDLHVLPVQLERKLIEYAVAQAKLKDEDHAASDRWFLKYEQGLPQVSTGRTVQMPGTMSFQPAPTYFELDALQNRGSRT
jgi:hypothetical protein